MLDSMLAIIRETDVHPVQSLLDLTFFMFNWDSSPYGHRALRSCHWGCGWSHPYPIPILELRNSATVYL